MMIYPVEKRGRGVKVFQIDEGRQRARIVAVKGFYPLNP